MNNVGTMIGTAIIIAVPLGIGVFMMLMAALFYFRLLEPQSRGEGDFAFNEVRTRSRINYSTVRVVKFVASDGNFQSPDAYKHAIVKLDGRYWMIQGIDKCPGLFAWLRVDKGQ